MKLKLSLAAATLAAGISFASIPGKATVGVSLQTLKTPAARSTLVDQAGWRGRCWWGIGGWHKYVKGVGRVQCTSHKCWTNRWGIRRCRWF
jgi:hypothetical protein